ncbi:MAG TPA: glycosyltransferase family 2 protein [Candidatus Krumholzibacteria bacterium]|nr:glycosyltransferase family 2 protein [Candidatus Krumholzibacteria bacterium]
MPNDTAPGPPSVTVIILTWNGRALTLDCLDSLAKVTTPNVRTLVVDNASADGTRDAIVERFGPRVTLIANPENLGYAAGNNVGIERALADGADFILLLNNDTVVDPAFIDELLKDFAAHPGAGIAGPKTYYFTPPDRIWFAGGEVSLWRGTARHIGIREIDHGQYDTAGPVDYVSGCALMARRAVFERIGALDDGYRAYFEDTDFCLRARHAGFGVRYVPTARIWHRISASTGGQLARRKVTRKLRSSARFFRRHARPWHWLTIPLFFGVDVVRIGLLILAGRIREPGPGSPQRTS